jgi:TolB protein
MPPALRLTLPVVLVACGGAAPAPSPPPAGFAITSTAELFAPGVVSSEHSEIRLAWSPDGATVLWGSTDRAGGPGSWDIWVSRRTGETWSAPSPASFDSPDKDLDPAYSPDGRWVYFFSNRPGGLGGDDLYRAAVTGDGFGPAEHLGPEVNTAGDEWAPAPSPDGKALMFASNRPGQKHDLFIAELRGDGFAPAAPLPGAVNTPADEFDATFLPDGRSIIFSRSADLENAPIALYFATRGAAGFDAGTALPPSVNVADGAAFGPAVHGGELYFTGKRPEAAVGKMDIYRVRYTAPTSR